MFASTADDAGAHFRAKAPRAEERALARLPQKRQHTNLAGERGGVVKAARAAQLSEQTRGSTRADAVNGGQKSANFVSLKLTLDVLVELPHSISQKLHIRARVFDLQLVCLGLMTSH
jgi:hypothetical protein